MEQDGVTGGSRPMPKATPEQTATKPAVGTADPVAPIGDSKPSKREKRSAAAVPTPGFNLK